MMNNNVYQYTCIWFIVINCVDHVNVFYLTRAYFGLLVLYTLYSISFQ